MMRCFFVNFFRAAIYFLNMFWSVSRVYFLLLLLYEVLMTFKAKTLINPLPPNEDLQSELKNCEENKLLIN